MTLVWYMVTLSAISGDIIDNTVQPSKVDCYQEVKIEKTKNEKDKVVICLSHWENKENKNGRY